MNRFRKALRLGLAMLISILPLNGLRVFVYRLVFGYRIAWGARIGFGTVIVVEQATIGRARIARYNRFIGPFTLHIADGAWLGPRNSLGCPEWVTRPPYTGYGYARSCRIGRKALVTGGHLIDTVGGFEMGEDSWLAGYGSQFWTHGIGVEDRTIVIGDRCYIGSACRFAPGAVIGDDCIVAMGSIVTGKFDQSRLLIGGVPARVLKEDYDRCGAHLARASDGV